MKRFCVFLVILLFPLCLVSAVATTKATATLNLLLPDNTLNFRFASDEDGTVLKSSPEFYLLTANVKGTQYALAYTSFYVWYDIFIESSVKLVIETDTVSSGSISDVISIVTSSTDAGVEASGLQFDDDNILITGSKTDVATFSDKAVHVGSKKFYLILDITNAKLNSTYSGTVKLKVEAVS